VTTPHPIDIMFSTLTEEEKLLAFRYKDAIDKMSTAMFEKLWHHRNKGQWEGVEPLEAFKLLLKEAAELLEAVLNEYSIEEVWKEAADVANFAMIIAEANQIRRNGDEIPFPK